MEENTMLQQLKEILQDMGDSISFQNQEEKFNWKQISINPTQDYLYQVNLKDSDKLEIEKNAFSLYKSIKVPQISLDLKKLDKTRIYFVGIITFNKTGKNQIKINKLKNQSLEFKPIEIQNKEEDKITFKSLYFTNTSQKYKEKMVIYIASKPRDQQNPNPQFETLIFSSPLIIYSRKKYWYQWETLLHVLKPFKPEILLSKYSDSKKNIYIKESENGINELRSYFNSSNIRGKLRNPFFLLFKFSKAVKLYYNNKLIKRVKEDPTLFEELYRQIYNRIVKQGSENDVNKDQPFLKLMLKEGNNKSDISSKMLVFEQMKIVHFSYEIYPVDNNYTELTFKETLLNNYKQYNQKYNQLYDNISNIEQIQTTKNQLSRTSSSISYNSNNNDEVDDDDEDDDEDPELQYQAYPKKQIKIEEKNLYQQSDSACSSLNNNSASQTMINSDTNSLNNQLNFQIIQQNDSNNSLNYSPDCTIILPKQSKLMILPNNIFDMLQKLIEKNNKDQLISQNLPNTNKNPINNNLQAFNFNKTQDPQLQQQQQTQHNIKIQDQSEFTQGLAELNIQDTQKLQQQHQKQNILSTSEITQPDNFFKQKQNQNSDSQQQQILQSQQNQSLITDLKKQINYATTTTGKKEQENNQIDLEIQELENQKQSISQLKPTQQRQQVPQLQQQQQQSQKYTILPNQLQNQYLFQQMNQTQQIELQQQRYTGEKSISYPQLVNNKININQIPPKIQVQQQQQQLQLPNQQVSNLYQNNIQVLQKQDISSQQIQQQQQLGPQIPQQQQQQQQLAFAQQQQQQQQYWPQQQQLQLAPTYPKQQQILQQQTTTRQQQPQLPVQQQNYQHINSQFQTLNIQSQNSLSSQNPSLHQSPQFNFQQQQLHLQQQHQQLAKQQPQQTQSYIQPQSLQQQQPNNLHLYQKTS